MTTLSSPILTLQDGQQRLQVLPALGASIATWERQSTTGWQPLLRPWNHATTDPYTFACFPLVPWSNRIGSGGFEQDGVFHPVQPNRAGEPYPIHGDAWLQAWDVAHQDDSTLTLQLRSKHFNGNPYHYYAVQRYCLDTDGLMVSLGVTHLGDVPLPYGLGLHPYFFRDGETRLQMQCDGMWLSGDDPMPLAHAQSLPANADYRLPSSLDGPLVDHCFTGWNGQVTIRYPPQGLTLELTMAHCDGYLLMYRPPGLDFFCIEPITHPIDAFHLPNRPGLRVLKKGEAMMLELALRVRAD